MPLFCCALALIIVGSIALFRRVQIQIRQAMELSGRPIPAAARYQPMLRLLSENGIGAVGRRAFRARRRAIFRGYLRCLTRDYSCLLAGLRTAMVNSGVDRPELARALTKNQRVFTFAILRIELGLCAHALGVGTVDVSGLVTALDVLRAQVPVFAPAGAMAR